MLTILSAVMQMFTAASKLPTSRALESKPSVSGWEGRRERGREGGRGGGREGEREGGREGRIKDVHIHTCTSYGYHCS